MIHVEIASGGGLNGLNGHSFKPLREAGYVLDLAACRQDGAEKVGTAHLAVAHKNLVTQDFCARGLQFLRGNAFVPDFVDLGHKRGLDRFKIGTAARLAVNDEGGIIIRRTLQIAAGAGRDPLLDDEILVEPAAQPLAQNLGKDGERSNSPFSALRADGTYQLIDRLGTVTRGSRNVTSRVVFWSGSIGRPRGGRSGPRAILP